MTRTKQLLIKLSIEELAELNESFKKDLNKREDVITRSEFIRELLKLAMDIKKSNKK